MSLLAGPDFGPISVPSSGLNWVALGSAFALMRAGDG